MELQLSNSSRTVLCRPDSWGESGFLHYTDMWFYHSCCVCNFQPTTMEFPVAVFPSWRNTQIASGCFKFLISTGSIPSLKSRAPHPTHNFFSLQIPRSPTFINTCHQSQRTCLFFLPFSPHVAQVSQSIQIFKHSLVNIYWLLNLSISLPTHEDWKPLDQSNHWSTLLLHLSSVKTITQPWNLASGRNMVSNSDQAFGGQAAVPSISLVCSLSRYHIQFFYHLHLLLLKLLQTPSFSFTVDYLILLLT